MAKEQVLILGLQKKSKKRCKKCNSFLWGGVDGDGILMCDNCGVVNDGEG